MRVLITGATGATTVEITGATGAVTVEMTGATGAVTVEITGATTVETTGVTGAATAETTEVTAPVTEEVTGAVDSVADPTESDAEGIDPPDVDRVVTPILNDPDATDAVSPLTPAATIDASVSVVKACNNRMSTFKAWIVCIGNSVNRPSFNPVRSTAVKASRRFGSIESELLVSSSFSGKELRKEPRSRTRRAALF
jgi:DNA-binding protein YbaB